MRISMAITLMGLMVVSQGAFAQVPVTGAKGATLTDLAGTPTLVTVVIKSTGAEDKNLKVLQVEDTYFTVETSRGEHDAYPYSAVREVRVQEGRVAAKVFRLNTSRALTQDERKIVARATQRATEIFSTANTDQHAKMEAAQLVMVGSKKEADNYKKARDYLNSLVSSNDLLTSLVATEHLYLAGDTANVKTMLNTALASGARMIKSQAAHLAGMAHYDAGTPTLMMMVQDRFPEFMSAAAIALARLGDRDVIPDLLTSISGLDDAKGTAAARALVLLGGSDVIQQMKVKLKQTDGAARFRVIYVLFKLSDPLGKQLMLDDAMKNPLEDTEAAMLLARAGDNAGVRWLREKCLSQPVGATAKEQQQRVEVVAALLASGDQSAITRLQGLLRATDASVLVKAYQEIALLGARSLLVLTQAGIENSNTKVALAAIQGALAIAHQNYRTRLVNWYY